ncbi:MAG TPA: hypothetical protein VMC42_05705 [Methanoregulaceae archaeon]|nr:hypothetical protein [Methanoregulaceae archaeon]
MRKTPARNVLKAEFGSLAGMKESAPFSGTGTSRFNLCDNYKNQVQVVRAKQRMAVKIFVSRRNAVLRCSCISPGIACTACLERKGFLRIPA